MHANAGEITNTHVTMGVGQDECDRSPFTGGGNRTHVAVSKNLFYDGRLIPLGYQFDKYFGSRVV